MKKPPSCLRVLGMVCSKAPMGRLLKGAALKKRFRYLGLGASVVASGVMTPLSAQEGSFLSKLNYGLQAGYVIPQGDIGNGFAFGVFSDYECNQSPI